MLATVFVPMIFSGSRISTLCSRAARANSASAEMPIPGAITPPKYSPFSDTASNVMAVPKSDDARAAVFFKCCHAVGNPVRTHFQRIVIVNGHSGPCAGPKKMRLKMKVTFGHFLNHGIECGYHA